MRTDESYGNRKYRSHIRPAVPTESSTRSYNHVSQKCAFTEQSDDGIV